MSDSLGVASGPGSTLQPAASTSIPNAISTLTAGDKPAAWVSPETLAWLAQGPDKMAGATLSARKVGHNTAALFVAQPAAPTDATIDQLFEALEPLAEQMPDGRPRYDYGLPTHDKAAMSAMRAAVREWLRNI